MLTRPSLLALASLPYALAQAAGPDLAAWREFGALGILVGVLIWLLQTERAERRADREAMERAGKHIAGSLHRLAEAADRARPGARPHLATSHEENFEP